MTSVGQRRHLAIAAVSGAAQRHDLCRACAAAGLTPIAATSTNDVVRLVERYDLSAAVVDTRLSPSTCAYELAQTIRDHRHGAQAEVVLLNHAQLSDSQRQILIGKFGLFDIVSPPIDSDLLARRLATELISEDYARSFSGNLERVPIPELLGRIYRRRLSGRLTLLTHHERIEIDWSDGSPQPPLGEDNRQDLLGRQLIDLFRLYRGHFQFVADVQTTCQSETSDVDMADTILGGLRCHWSEERLLERIRPFLDSYPNASSIRHRDIHCDLAEHSFRDEMDGTRTVRRVLTDTVLSRKRALDITYGLIVLGGLTLRS